MQERTLEHVNGGRFAATFTAIALSLTLWVAAAFAVPGDLDTAFSGDGKATTNFSSGLDWANSVALQADGKIVAAGTVDLADGFAVARYNTNGTLDTSADSTPGTNFSGDGIDTIGTTGDGLFSEAFGVAIQPSDQKIVVAGVANGPDGSDDFALARFNTNGTLDAGFGAGDGTLVTQFAALGVDGSTYNNDHAEAVAIRSDGYIVAAGVGDPTTGAAGNEGDFAVARYDSNGALDNGFGGDGKVTIDIAPTDSFDVGHDLVLIPGNNKVLVAGSEINFNGRGSALAQFNSDGTPDNSFDDNGIRIRNFTGDDELLAAARQSNGKIVAGGFTGDDFAMFRFNADGTNDNSFDDNGYIATTFNSSTFDQVWNDVAIAGDGKIFGAGVANQGNGGFWAVGRFFANGTVDRGFGTCNGAARTSFADSGGAEGMVIDGSGRVVAAGFGPNDFGLARFLTAGGAPDCSNPNTTVKGPRKTSKPRPTYRLVSTEAGSHFRCRINGRGTSKPFTDCRTPFKMPRLKLGPTRFEVRAIDKAGNADPSPAFLKIKRIRKRR